MGQALYRKYRSKSLSEIVGQEHITDTLAHAIQSGRISHAYLFTGPRGVGKTSIARILAHELNGVPYVGEDNHLDIIEIDAASNGGVDEVRELREKVHIAPAYGKYKVYIIDEVHMMTTAAFNALLKTLEEPPAHAVFILATTESHKLPATIISRTQRFTFKPIARDKVTKHLRHIADTEKIDITDEALDLIAEHSEGSFRDSISMLDQAGNLRTRVDRAEMEKLFGIPPVSAAEEILNALTQHDTTALITLLTTLRTSGYQAAAIAKLLGQVLRLKLVDGQSSLGKARTLTVLRSLIEVPASQNPEQLLEIVLLEADLDPATPSATTLAPKPTAPAQAQKPVDKSPRAVSQPAAVAVSPSVAQSSTDETDEAPDNPDGEGIILDESQWQAVLASLKKQYNTLYGVMRMARPDFLPGKVKLTFGYAFHQKRASDAKTKKILVTVLQEITGHAVAIECAYDKNVTPPAPQLPQEATQIATNEVKPPATDSSLSTISNIFGGGELLES